MIYLYLFGTCFHFIYVFMIIGNNVQKYRKELGLSQERLAELAGVHRTYRNG